MTRYPLYRRLGGPQGRSEQVRKISPPPGFDPRTVQPVTSHYTDRATRPTQVYVPVWNGFWPAGLPTECGSRDVAVNSAAGVERRTLGDALTTRIKITRWRTDVTEEERHGDQVKIYLWINTGSPDSQYKQMENSKTWWEWRLMRPISLKHQVFHILRKPTIF
jgi:hypothetical protein